MTAGHHVLWEYLPVDVVWPWLSNLGILGPCRPMNKLIASSFCTRCTYSSQKASVLQQSAEMFSWNWTLIHKISRIIFFHVKNPYRWIVFLIFLFLLIFSSFWIRHDCVKSKFLAIPLNLYWSVRLRRWSVTKSFVFLISPKRQDSQRVTRSHKIFT